MSDVATKTAVNADWPITTADALLRGQRLLVLAPHPDDESLGCGALLVAAFAGPGAHVVCLTDGSASHPGSRTVPPDALARIRRKELSDAVANLGGTDKDITWLGAPDSALRPEHGASAALTDLLRSGVFGLVLAPSPLDPHCDHVVAADIGRKIVAEAPQMQLAFYPIWSRWHAKVSTPHPAGTRAWRLAAGAAAARKTAAIAAHRSQAGLVVRDCPDGFSMPPGFAEFFSGGDELYFLVEKEVQDGRR